MPYLFTSESVSEGHPDKVADQISDALLDEFLAWDPKSKVACETLVTTGQVIVAGEVKSHAYVDVPRVVRKVIADIGYTKAEYMFEAHSCGILSAIHEQSPDISQGVDKARPEEQGAGDQGMMFGYACNETEDYMPLPIMLAHMILRELSALRKMPQSPMPYLGPDAKSQVTVLYDDNHCPLGLDTIVISTQHDEFIKPSAGVSAEEAEKRMQAQIREDLLQYLFPRLREALAQTRVKTRTNLEGLLDTVRQFYVNPTGKFVIGGPHGDTGLTGRKIIVDTYGGRGAHGGGAFSGKDPSKVDRSAAYALRHLAKNLVAAGLCEEVLVQVSYAIGVAEPVSLYVNTFGTSRLSISDDELGKRLREIYPLRPYDIEQRFNLRTPIYLETAAYGHMGRKPQRVTKEFCRQENGTLQKKILTVELFPWEKTDMTDLLKKEFGSFL
ncbi:MAG: methionine adenosyltransferase [Flavobacteriales bacterium]|nr:methionine adenosyltransferase [Flavobacteriales bacterium]MCX7768753.1 methionine adenosyltransferase [Flavobacteriales bacterium]MDW8409912.1 methionine adenosyltransferase [Flavobacteriales bacterium]